MDEDDLLSYNSSHSLSYLYLEEYSKEERQWIQQILQSLEKKFKRDERLESIIKSVVSVIKSELKSTVRTLFQVISVQDLVSGQHGQHANNQNTIYRSSFVNYTKKKKKSNKDIQLSFDNDEGIEESETKRRRLTDIDPITQVPSPSDHASAVPTSNDTPLDSQHLPIVPFLLIGKLAIQNDGSFAIIDDTGCIPSVILNISSELLLSFAYSKYTNDSFSPVILFETWNFISSTNSPYVEVESYRILGYQSDFPPILDKLQTTISRSMLNYQTVEEVADQCREKKSVPKGICSIVGYLTAKSPLFTFHAKSRKNSEKSKTNYFFIEVASTPDDEESLTTSILFTGDQAVKWFSFLDVRHGYIISCLKSSLIFKGKPQQRSILSSTKKTIISNSPEEATKCSENILKVPFYNTQQLSQENQLSTRSIQLISYCGTITSIIAHSVFELDSQYRLYLIHYLCPNEGRGLRIGVKVKLYNVHVISNETGIEVRFYPLRQLKLL